MFEINYSQLMQYEILEKLVTYILLKSLEQTVFKPVLFDVWLKIDHTGPQKKYWPSFGMVSNWLGDCNSKIELVKYWFLNVSGYLAFGIQVITVADIS